VALVVDWADDEGVVYIWSSAFRLLLLCRAMSSWSDVSPYGWVCRVVNDPGDDVGEGDVP